MSDSPVAIVAAALVAVALIAAAALLAFVDPAARGQLEGGLLIGIGSVTGYFFSARSAAAGVHAATNGMSTAAGLLAAGAPAPAAPKGSDTTQ